MNLVRVLVALTQFTFSLLFLFLPAMFLLHVTFSTNLTNIVLADNNFPYINQTQETFYLIVDRPFEGFEHLLKKTVQAVHKHTNLRSHIDS